MLDSAVALDVFQEIFDHVSANIKPGAAGSGALLVYGGVDKIFYVNKDFGVLDPKVLALDVLVLTLTIGAVVHAALAGKLVRLPLYFLIGLTLEQSSVRLGGTHCHSEGIVMVSKCSSLNSVAYYVPWIHLALEVAGRLSLGFVARVFVAGLLGFSLCGVYEVQGPRQGWWAYPVHKDTGLPLTSKLWTLHGGLSNVFAVNDHAGLALAERWHGMPVMAILMQAMAVLMSVLLIIHPAMPVAMTALAPILMTTLVPRITASLIMEPWIATAVPPIVVSMRHRSCVILPTGSTGTQYQSHRNTSYSLRSIYWCHLTKTGRAGLC